MLTIQTGTNNQILRKVSLAVTKVTPELRQLIEEMFVTMQHEKGVGLAAPQVGQNIRLILVTLSKGRKHEVFPMFNPELLQVSSEQEICEEGCLSIPGVFAEVTRAAAVTVNYLDENGKAQFQRLEGMNARVVQHEIDHLNGVLFTDYLDQSTLAKLPKLKNTVSL